MTTQLPDVSAASPTSPRAGRSMSSLEQRKAIDDMISQRDKEAARSDDAAK